MAPSTASWKIREVAFTHPASGGRSARGLFAPEKCPPELYLTTGLVGDRPHTLTREHRDFAPFAWAWTQQDTWSEDEHHGYWTAHLDRWPRARPASTEILAYALRAARARGLTDDDHRLDALLGHDIEDVKRMLRRHRERRPDDVPELGEPVVSHWPLPRIWAIPEAPPNPHGYRLEPSVYGLPPNPRAGRIAAALAALSPTPAAPRDEELVALTLARDAGGLVALTRARPAINAASTPAAQSRCSACARRRRPGWKGWRPSANGRLCVKCAMDLTAGRLAHELARSAL